MKKTRSEYFLLGIKGVGMSSLALILSGMGNYVWGADTDEEFITDKYLLDNKISIKTFEDAQKSITKNTVCIYSASHSGYNNKLIQYAVHIGCTIYNQAEFVQKLSTYFQKSIAISGSHGKTTTTALTSYCMKYLSGNLAYMFGSSNGGFYSGNNYFIYEADEYAVDPPRDITPKILHYIPDYLVLSNIDFDHPDVFRNIQHSKQVYKKWIKMIYRNKPKAKFVLNGDDNLVSDIINTIPKGNVYSVGYDKKNSYRIFNNSIVYPDGNIYTLKTNIIGKHNVLNSSLVFVLLNKVLGYSHDEIINLFLSFNGTKRRMEKIFDNGKYLLYDDYAHHPNEIIATLKAFRQEYPKRKIHLIFQPHTFSRTKALYKDFIRSFKFSDCSYILPIFPSAREKNRKDIASSEILTNDSRNIGIDCIYVHSYKDLKKTLLSRLTKKDLIVTMGAGDVYKMHENIIQILKII